MFYFEGFHIGKKVIHAQEAVDLHYNEIFSTTNTVLPVHGSVVASWTPLEVRLFVSLGTSYLMVLESQN